MTLTDATTKLKDTLSSFEEDGFVVEAIVQLTTKPKHKFDAVGSVMVTHNEKDLEANIIADYEQFIINGG